jgi:hypothetical protein
MAISCPASAMPGIGPTGPGEAAERPRPTIADTPRWRAGRSRSAALAPFSSWRTRSGVHFLPASAARKVGPDRVWGDDATWIQSARIGSRDRASASVEPLEARTKFMKCRVEFHCDLPAAGRDSQHALGKDLDSSGRAGSAGPPTFKEPRPEHSMNDALTQVAAGVSIAFSVAALEATGRLRNG